MKPTKNLDPIVTVTADSAKSKFSTSTVLSNTLLSYNQKISQNIYRIDRLDQLSAEFAPNENIYILAHDVSSDFPSHVHNYSEITYVCQGGILNIVDNNKFYMSTGDLAILNPCAVHEIKYTSPDTLIINICLKDAVFQKTLKSFYEDDNFISRFFRNEASYKTNYMFFSLGHNLNAQAILSDLIQEYSSSGFRQSFAVEAYLLLLFTQLMRANSYSYYGVDDHTLKLINYIRTHCLSQTLGEMALALGYNPNYLTTYIKKHTGKNCSTIIQEVRLNEALNLLENSDLSIYDIAEECGYTSASHFFRIFKQKYNLTPNEYRMQVLR
ncbi:MAG TPA: AraC family transcriptional regulator [Clostridiales bacterium]|nr:AraC family transcriptional regulator [Clostridiales bacterium]